MTDTISQANMVPKCPIPFCYIVSTTYVLHNKLMFKIWIITVINSTIKVEIKSHWPLYLLSLLKLQFNWGFDAVAGVLVGLFKCQLHQVLMVCPSHVATHENDNIGQNLGRKRGQWVLVRLLLILTFLSSQFLCYVQNINTDMLL